MLNYPHTRTEDQVDDYHGHRIRDPYRWLENDHAPDTKAWVEAQNALTATWLARVPEREELRQALREWWNAPRRGAPWRRGRYWFQLRNSGLQDQDVLWVAEAHGDAPAPDDASGDLWRVLLDPNRMSSDGTVAVSGLAASHDGSQLAYATSGAGSDWMTWHVRDVADGEDGPDLVEWSKFSTAAWTRDGAGFFYAAYDKPADDETYLQTNRNQRLWYHRIGTDQARDALVYDRPDQPEWGFVPSVSHCGRWLVVHIWHGTDPRNRVYIADLHAAGPEDSPPATLVPLLDAFDAAYDFIGVVSNGQDRALFRTDCDAPRGRVIAVTLPDAPHATTGEGVLGLDTQEIAPQEIVPQEIVPEQQATLESVHLIAGTDGAASELLMVQLENASSRLRRWTVTGDPEPLGEVELPGIGTVVSLTSRPDRSDAYIEFSSFTAPPQVHRLHPTTATRHTVFAAAVPTAVEMVTEQVWYRSADGTRIPMFVVHRSDITPGERPTLLWGYGGFNIPITPMFRAPWAVWLTRGGVLAVPNLRGGGEFGRSWHDAGRLRRKQNTFDDAIAAASWLIDEGWTTPSRLAISGGSNGGLLVGACITQRPDLFGAAVAEVGVLDMLRFHRFTIGWAWQSDYGNPEDPDDFAVLLGYSPLHALRPQTSYPPTLITTGDHDDRVVPAHSFKFAAAMQAAQAGEAPVLIRIETDAGHGAGKPISKMIDERADVLAFLEATIGQ